MKMKRRIISTFLAACMVTTCMAGMSATASADGDTSYTITIPETLTVQNIGWNSIGNISASGTLASGKKLKVEATSANNWALTSTSDSVSYTLNNGSTEKGDAATSWEFTKEQLSTGATQAIGIDVADYSTKPAGTYTDTVTFTASVVDKAVTFTVKRVGAGNGWNYEDGNYTVAAGTTWQQFIDSGDAPACLSIVGGKVWHDMNASIMDCGGTLIANTADKKHVKPSDVIIDGATYGCSDYLGYQDHD